MWRVGRGGKGRVALGGMFRLRQNKTEKISRSIYSISRTHYFDEERI